MAVELLVLCAWADRRCHQTEVTHPSWLDVEAAIRALNGSDRNDLYLHPVMGDPETYLCVGGGAGRYVVNGAIANDTFPAVIDPQKSPGGNERLVVGGQASQYPAEQILSLDLALRATRAFFESGRFEGGGAWTLV